jgi:hypothetical protein
MAFAKIWTFDSNLNSTDGDVPIVPAVGIAYASDQSFSAPGSMLAGVDGSGCVGTGVGVPELASVTKLFVEMRFKSTTTFGFDPTSMVFGIRPDNSHVKDDADSYFIGFDSSTQAHLQVRYSVNISGPQTITFNATGWNHAWIGIDSTVNEIYFGVNGSTFGPFTHTPTVLPMNCGGSFAYPYGDNALCLSYAPWFGHRDLYIDDVRMADDIPSDYIAGSTYIPPAVLTKSYGFTAPIINNPTTFVHGATPAVITLDTTELAALISDSYYQVVTNWKTVMIVYRSTLGQKDTLIFRRSSPSAFATDTFNPDVTARAATYSVSAIYVADYNGGIYNLAVIPSGLNIVVS